MNENAQRPAFEARHDASVRHDSPWHALPAEIVLDRVGSVPGGLSAAEAAARLLRNGPNTLPEPPRPHALLRLARQFHSALIYFLLSAAAAAAILDHLVDAAVITFVAVVSAVIGFVQEGRAEQALDAIRQMIAPKAPVLRGGHRGSIPVEELVTGDVVLLEPGDAVPADLRLLRARSLLIDEAILTGESVASSSAVRTVDFGSFGPAGRSATEVRLRHLATVFWLIP